MRAKPKRKPSREQVKAWLGTVLTPMSGSLRVEYDRASKGNWSFRCDTRDFEFLWRTEEMLSPVYRPNLEQLWRYYPTLREQAKAHDEALVNLQKACQAAFERILQSEEFDRLREQFPVEKDDRKYLAEYVVNGLRDLPSHYALSDIWRDHGNKFLDLRSKPALKPGFEEVRRAGELFRREVEHLLQEIERIQEALADKFQLPPVDPASAGLL